MNRKERIGLEIARLLTIILMIYAIRVFWDYPITDILWWWGAILFGTGLVVFEQIVIHIQEKGFTT